MVTLAERHALLGDPRALASIPNAL